MSHAGRSGTTPDYLPFTDTDVEPRPRKLVGTRCAHYSSTDHESVEGMALHITRICAGIRKAIQRMARGIREETQVGFSGSVRHR